MGSFFAPETDMIFGDGVGVTFIEFPLTYFEALIGNIRGGRITKLLVQL